MSYDLSVTNATNTSITDCIKSPSYNQPSGRALNLNQKAFKVKSGGFKVSGKRNIVKTNFLTNFEKESPRVNLGRNGNYANKFYHQSVCTTVPLGS